ncbi:MAG: VCBS repeat-containing protein [Planctomycetota bacterium]|nr:VCBS repeat-containing protein [Planctomycetota bacterium]MDA1210919.1 VCBS repeat-containing protein [Planctomycetota bacterium]
MPLGIQLNQVTLMMVAVLWMCDTGVNASCAESPQYFIPVSITSPLIFAKTPIYSVIDFGKIIRDSKLDGVLDPNSIEVWNAETKREIPHALTEEFSYDDSGHVEFVIDDPDHRAFEIRFRLADKRPSQKTQTFTPQIGVGDLLRFNSREPRPLTLSYALGLYDLNNDGTLDLTGTWNYAYRPGWPWDGVVCYPGQPGGSSRIFGDLTRLRYITDNDPSKRQFFSHIYMSNDFADFNDDGLLDLVVTRSGSGVASFFLNTGEREITGMPVYREGGSAKCAAWQACRAVDLDGDKVIDLVVDGEFIRNSNSNGWPFKAEEAVKLEAGRQPCFLDVDGDSLLDAVCLHGSEAVQPDFYRIAWRKNLGDDSPVFGDEKVLDDIDAQQCSLVSTYRNDNEAGLIVQHDAFQQIAFYTLSDGKTSLPRFERKGRAESVSAVMSLSDQAWPCVCDWDNDGDADLLVGGGYGWPRIVINEGSRETPAFAEPQLIYSEGEPIRFVRNEILGEPVNWHDMGYPFPDFVDWDGDGLNDLVFPNETNRLFWYKNVGTNSEPKFGPRLQILCDGYPDSPELRKLSAERANEPNSNNGVYPYEKEQPFLWRTGTAFADFNGDGLMDFITHDGEKHVATLFAQYRDDEDSLRLTKAGVMKLKDGRSIDDKIVNRAAHWTESFRAVDWDGDGLHDLIYSIAGAHGGSQDGGSIYLLKNVGTASKPLFDAPQTMKCFGEPIRITNHGPHPWPGDFDGDGQPDLITCVEWSVYPYYSHAALMMKERPTG